MRFFPCNSQKGKMLQREKQGPKGPPGPPGIQAAYGYAYHPLDCKTGGEVKFSVAGPLQEVELDTEGLRILKAGVYEISYKVTVESENDESNSAKASFQIVVNDKIKLVSSFMETNTSLTHLFSTQLCSLLEGDVVKLVAELPQGFAYKLPTLQVIQVG